MKSLLLCLYLLAGVVTSASAQFSPVGFREFDHVTDTNRHLFKSDVSNYFDGATWDSIRTEWNLVGGIYRNDRAFWQVAVTDSGVCSLSVRIPGQPLIQIVARPRAMLWIDLVTKDTTHLFGAPRFNSARTVSGGRLTFPNIWPGIDAFISQRRASIDYGFSFKPVFLDSLQALYEQRADSNQIALGHAVEYKLVGVDSATYVGERYERLLKRVGALALRMKQQSLQSPNMTAEDTEVPVLQRWVRSGARFFCVEIVKASDLIARHRLQPTETLWHNATFSGATTVSGDDGYYREGAAEFSISNQAFAVGLSAGFNYIGGVRFQSVSVVQGTTIDSAWITLYASATEATTPSLNWWGEDTASATVFVTVDSTGFKTRNKTTATVVWNTVASTAGTPYRSSDFKTLVQEIVNRANWAANNNMAFIYNNNGSTIRHLYASWDNGTYTEPQITIYYTTGGASDFKTFRRRRIINLLGEIDHETDHSLRGLLACAVR